MDGIEIVLSFFNVPICLCLKLLLSFLEVIQGPLLNCSPPLITCQIHL